MKKITYKEYFLDENLERVTYVDGIELKEATDHNWKQLVDYYTNLREEGVVDSVMIDPQITHTNLNITQYGTDGSQYHRVYTKWV